MITKATILLAACLASAPALAAEPTSSRATAAKPDPGAAELSQRVATLRRSSADLRAAARQPAPKGLTPEQVAQVKDYDTWLAQSSSRLEALANEGDKLLKTGASPEQAMDFNLQYLQLQSQMQHENRSYTAISNIMKTKHDTVKNSISNIR
jgi:hypothetical protein